MILRRIGRKTKLAAEIRAHFPPHDIYIEPFFGAGGLFFNKPLAKYNYLNDIDSDVFNLYRLFQEQPVELQRQYNLMPLSGDLLNYWKKNPPQDPIPKALAFLLRSNSTYLGSGDTLHMSTNREKDMFNHYFEKTFTMLKNCKIQCKDYRSFLKSISFKHGGDRGRAFIYADPPYFCTVDNYANGFSLEDTQELFAVLCGERVRFAVSEYDRPEIRDIANQHGLRVEVIAERRTLKSRNTEVLVMNYESPHARLFK